MSPEKCGRNIDRLLLMQFVLNIQNLQLALTIEAVPAFRFNRGGSIRSEPFKVSYRTGFQFLGGRAAQAFHARADSASALRDIFVRSSGISLFVLRGAACGENEMRVGIDKSGKDNATAEIELFSIARFSRTFNSSPRADRDDSIVVDQQCTV